jgi:hypothetical protein
MVIKDKAEGRIIRLISTNKLHKYLKKMGVRGWRKTEIKMPGN